ASPAAPTFTVNNTADIAANPADPDPSICRTATNNTTCTLRAAIMQADRYLPGGVTIHVPAGVYTLTIPPAGPNDILTGDFNITNTLTIIGAGAATSLIDANGLDRVFSVGGGVTVTIQGVTIRNGSTADDGGGVLSNGRLTLVNSVVSGNAAAGSGGGIATVGRFSLNQSRVEANTAGLDGGGLFVGGSATDMDRSAISGNRSEGSGGGISNFSILTITRSTVNHNLVTNAGIGGGIFVFGGLTMNNSTLTANSATGDGGGLLTSSGSSELYLVTVAGNVAGSKGGGGTGGGLWGQYAETQAGNSLLAENYAGSSPNDCGLALLSWDYNYIQTTTNCSIDNATTHNHSGGDAWLGPLANYGGATFTRALLPGSPALEQIPTSECRDSFNTLLPPDQRGTARPVGDLCDNGAVEGVYAPAIYNRNLVRNGDAESGGASPTGADIGLPNWNKTTGAASVIDYGTGGGFLDPATDPVPANHGYNFFVGGQDLSTVITQVVTINSIGAAIDSGQVHYALSAYLGYYLDSSNQASVRAVFRTISGAAIGSPVVIGPPASLSGADTGFVPFSHSGTLPAGTRSVLIELDMEASLGYNFALADNVSLVLSSVVHKLYLPFIRR
ncbi:MAG: choice-of-anchor Q domain-containing protein, partial [Anaerolineales bacterium]